MKTIYRKFFLAALFSVFFFISSNGKALEKNDLLPYTDSLTGWVYLLENEIYLTFEEFLDNYNEILGLPEQHNFTYSLHPSPYNEEVTYVKLFQTFNDFEVERSRITLHLRNNYVEIITGAFIENLPLLDNRRARSFQIVLDEEIALANALNALNIDPAIFDENNTLMYSGSTNLEEGEESTSNIKPQGHLKYARKTDSETANNEYVLAWEFLISQADTSFERVLVNATNGLIEEISDAKVYGQYGKGNVQTLYNGYRTADIESFKCSFCVNWSLENSTGVTTYLGSQKCKDGDNNWTEVNQRSASSAHWAIGKIREFFNTLQWHGSFDNNFKIEVKTELNLPDNAYSTERGSNLSEIGIGYASNNGKSLSTIDVIAHEYAHLIINRTSQLVYSKESGALNEGFADIFATMAEQKIEYDIHQLTAYDFKIGEDAGGNIRDMATPMGYNDIFSGWQSLTNSWDNYGVHTNCGVLNHWFYRLATAIGRFQAGTIAFGANMLLNPNDGYFQTKSASILVAREYYGFCSDQHLAVYDAWSTVGVVRQMESYPYCPPLIFPSPALSERSSDLDQNQRDFSRSFLIYPNPVKDVLNIKVPDCMIGGSFSISGVDGKRIITENINQASLTIDLQNLKAGVYFVNMRNASNQYYHKIIK